MFRVTKVLQIQGIIDIFMNFLKEKSECCCLEKRHNYLDLFINV
jgi:hypothetical protein